MTRVLTAAVLIPVVTYVVLWGHQYLFLGVLVAVSVLCFREYATLVAAHRIEKPGPFAYAAGALILLTPAEGLALATGLALLALALGLLSAPPPSVLTKAGSLVLGVLYIFGAWKTAVWLRALDPHWLFFALMLTWLGDTAAFVVGKVWGRHKLAPRLSPAKTWEGSIGSLAASLVFGWSYLEWMFPGTPVWQRFVLAAAANVAGQVGDLAESALKRGAGVKDSGNLLPGHGGWLDRTDSCLFALPVTYGLLLWFGVR